MTEQGRPGVMSVLEDLVMLYDAWGQHEKAAEYRELLREAEEPGASD